MLIVFEATGAYHRGLERYLGQAGLSFIKVNPRQARRFAQVIGRLAKTDDVDARMLARMGVVLDLVPQSAEPEDIHDLRELLTARRATLRREYRSKVQSTAGRVLRHMDIRSCDGGTLSGNPPLDRHEGGGPVELFTVEEAGPDLAVQASVQLDFAGLEVQEHSRSRASDTDQAVREAMLPNASCESKEAISNSGIISVTRCVVPYQYNMGLGSGPIS